MKKNLKGSMTVEAAFVVPLVLMVISALILLTMFVHNRAWYTAVSAEAVISASTDGVRSGQEAQKTVAGKMAERKGEQGFPAGEITMIAAAGENYVRTQTQIRSGGVMGVGSWKAEVAQRSEFVRPVPFIRNLLAIKAWKER
ncbi:MAG: TadE family protein [Ruminococcus sp.]|jgi:hypothetical protein